MLYPWHSQRLCDRSECEARVSSRFYVLRASLMVQLAVTHVLTSSMRFSFVQMHVWLLEAQVDWGTRSVRQSRCKWCQYLRVKMELPNLTAHEGSDCVSAKARSLRRVTAQGNNKAQSRNHRILPWLGKTLACDWIEEEVRGRFNLLIRPRLDRPG